MSANNIPSEPEMVQIPSPKVIYEDEDIVVIDKPAGLLVHPIKLSESLSSVNYTEPTVAGWFLEHCPGAAEVGDDPAVRPGIVHRLDKDTSGVMMLAKNQETFEYLKSLFKNHEVRKTYLAVVRGIFKSRSGVIDSPIGIRNGTVARSVRSDKMAKSAVTKYKVIKEYGTDVAAGSQFSLLEITPETGRTHQIRVHLSSIGHPVEGDRIYGGKAKKSSLFNRLMLHALSLEFTARDGKRARFETEPPGEFQLSPLIYK